MTENQVNCVPSFISNHSVQGFSTSKDLVYVSNKLRQHWVGGGHGFTFGFQFKQMEMQNLMD